MVLAAGLIAALLGSVACIEDDESGDVCVSADNHLARCGMIATHPDGICGGENGR